MRSPSRGLRTTGLLCVLAGTTLATTYVPPRDLGELARGSDAVVFARAGASIAAARGSLVFTDTTFVVEESLSGPFEPGSEAIVQTPGGEVAGRGWTVAGSPRFEPGTGYLLCLRHKEPGLWVPSMLSYGLLAETADPAVGPRLEPVLDGAIGVAFPRSDGLVAEAIGSYPKEPLLAHLADVIAGAASWKGASLAFPPAPSTKAAPAACAFFTSGGRKYRWRAFDAGDSATVYTSDTGDSSVAGGGFREIARAIDYWMAVSGTNLNLIFGGPRPSAISCTSGQDAEADMIVLNDPCSDISALSNCSGILAYGGPLTGSTHTFDGASWITITGWIVVVNDGAGCIGATNYGLMIAHELGHGLGFDHFEDSAAMMYAYCCNAINATDTLCLRYVYPPSNPSNQRPVVDAGPTRTIALTGSTAHLEGTVSDDGVTGPLATRWRMVGGPAPVAFGDRDAAATSVTFPQSGTYILTLTADDGALIKTDAVEITVETNIGSTRLLTFQEGENGYQSTIDTFIEEANPSSSHATATELSIDGDRPSSSGLRTEALLRFDALFGGQADQIPPGAEVRSARLELSSADDGTGAAFYRMLEPWEEAATWNSFGAQGIAVGSDTAPQPDAQVAGRGLASVDVTASLRAWSQDPCANRGWALLPQGSDGWAVYSAEGATPPRLSVEYAIRPEVKLAAAGDTWRYFKGTVDPPAAWKEASFVPDARWRSGPTGIGFGDGDDATVLADMEGSYLTIYCRREFEIAAGAAPSKLILSIDYDDGFVAYLNGTEVARSASMGVPGAPVTRTTEAASREAGAAEVYAIDVSALREGTNAFAVEVHNADIGSSDLSFIPELTATYALLDAGHAWRYLRGSATVPADWNQLGFDDGSWELGATGIGFGDGDDETVLADMEGSYLSVFCRATFEIADPAAFDELLLTVVYDDGIVVYLNGEELGRQNMPAGPVDAATPASGGVEAARAVFTIPRSRLRAGTNLLAASVHNSGIANTDLSFNPVLVAAARRAAVNCGGEPTFRRGDVNDEGSVNVADAVALLSHLFARCAAPACPDAADANDDGTLDISDAVQELRHLFGSAVVLPAPGSQSCGFDPTLDTLGACGAASCPPEP